MNLIDKLVLLRKSNNYSQSDIANKLGIDTFEYMSIENGNKAFKYEYCVILSKLYKINLEDLFCYESELKIKKREENSNVSFKLPLFRYRYYIITILLLLILITSLLPLLGNKKEERIKLKANYHIKAADTFVVYNDLITAYGRGENTNGQLNIDSTNVVKVDAGASFSVVLENDGKVKAYGLINRLNDPILKWENIIDIAVGDDFIVGLKNNGRVLCEGNNTNGNCSLSKYSAIKRILVDRKLVILFEEKNYHILGETSFMNSLKNEDVFKITSIASNGKELVMSFIDGSVKYLGSNNYNLGAFKNIRKVVIGDNFIAGLKNDGRVILVSGNYLLNDEVSKWKNIVDISATNDYLVAYDGNKVYGVGNNAYEQFDKNEIEAIELSKPTGLKISNDEEKIVINFNEVANASGYKLNIYPNNLEFKSKTNFIEVPLTSFLANKEYRLSLKALSDNEYYKDSEAFEINWLYEKMEDNNNEEENKVTIIEFPFKIESLIGKTKIDFLNYLANLGYDLNKLKENKSELSCPNNQSEAIITKVEGIVSGEELVKSQLLEREISYEYCEIKTSQ